MSGGVGVRGQRIDEVWLFNVSGTEQRARSPDVESEEKKRASNAPCATSFEFKNKVSDSEFV